MSRNQAKGSGSLILEWEELKKVEGDTDTQISTMDGYYRKGLLASF